MSFLKPCITLSLNSGLSFRTLPKTLAKDLKLSFISVGQLQKLGNRDQNWLQSNSYVWASGALFSWVSCRAFFRLNVAISKISVAKNFNVEFCIRSLNIGSSHERSILMFSGPSRSGIVLRTNSGPSDLIAQPVAYSTSLLQSKLWLSRRSLSFSRSGFRIWVTFSLLICRKLLIKYRILLMIFFYAA